MALQSERGTGCHDRGHVSVNCSLMLNRCGLSNEKTVGEDGDAES